MTNIHNHLSGRIKHQNIGGPAVTLIRNHGNWVDDRRCIEHGLQYDFPNMSHVTEIHEQRSKQQSYAKTKAIQLNNAERHKQYSPRVMRMGEETEADHHEQVDAERNHRTHSGGSHNNVVREMNLTQQITAANNGLHTHASGFGEEAPQAGTAQQRNRERRGAVGELQELHEHHIHHSEQHKRLQHGPHHAEERSLVTQLEIGFHQFLEYHYRVVVPLFEAVKKVLHKRPILLVRSI